MKKNLLQALTIFFLLLPLPALAGAPAHKCLSYEPEKVRLTGKITVKTFPGPPNYESIEKGDRPETQWILKLANPVCVDGDPKSELNSESEKDVKEVQLITFEDDKKYRHLLSGKVTATGTLPRPYRASQNQSFNGGH